MYIYIYWNTSKMRITMETEQQSSAFKRLLETLLLAIKMCTGFTTDVIWVCSVTSEPTQSSSKCY